MTDADAPVNAPLLTLSGLRVAFPTFSGVVFAVAGVSLSLREGEVLGLVGESGSGKSVTCRAILGLVPPPGDVVAGTVHLGTRNLRTLRPRELRRVRAREMGVVFQDPFNSLNPVFTVGQQLREVLRRNLGLRRGEAHRRSVDLLSRVGIAAPEKRMDAYPNELSGGMRQRVAIALALAPQPRLLIADEPTTALDVTVQDQILHLLLDLRRDSGMAILLVSHDMGVIAQTCDTVAVMYAGYIVETAAAADLFVGAKHPYTRALLDAVPSVRSSVTGRSLSAIPGNPPDLRSLQPGCPFAPRCSFVRESCADVPMVLVPEGQGHSTACPFVDASTATRETSARTMS